MREKGHQNWPLVIGPRYDPHLPFSGQSVSKPWSKRDTSSSIPPFQEMSVPRCPTATSSCGPGRPKQRPASFCRPASSAEKELQHIFMRLSDISCFIILKERIVSASQRWNMWHQEMVWCCYSLVWEEECIYIFFSKGVRADAVQKLVWQFGIRGEQCSMCFDVIPQITLFYCLHLLHFKTQSIFWLSSVHQDSSSLKVREVGLYLLDSPHQLGKSQCWKGKTNVFASNNNHFSPICSTNAAQRPKTRCLRLQEQKKKTHA